MGQPPSEKIRIWSRRFARFCSGRQTVAQFCNAEGVSEASYYYWKRKLDSTDLPSDNVSQNLNESNARTPSNLRPTFEAVSIVSEVTSPSTLCLGPDVEIRFGNDLPTVATIVQQLVKQLIESQPTQRPASNGGAHAELHP